MSSEKEAINQAVKKYVAPVCTVSMLWIFDPTDSETYQGFMNYFWDNDQFVENVRKELEYMTKNHSYHLVETVNIYTFDAEFDRIYRYEPEFWYQLNFSKVPPVMIIIANRDLFEEYSNLVVDDDDNYEVYIGIDDIPDEKIIELCKKCSNLEQEEKDYWKNFNKGVDQSIKRRNYILYNQQKLKLESDNESDILSNYLNSYDVWKENNNNYSIDDFRKMMIKALDVFIERIEEYEQCTSKLIQ